MAQGGGGRHERTGLQKGGRGGGRGRDLRVLNAPRLNSSANRSQPGGNVVVY